MLYWYYVLFMEYVLLCKMYYKEYEQTNIFETILLWVYVAQAGPELLSSRNPPVSAS